jgi:hypothetical protein
MTKKELLKVNTEKVEMYSVLKTTAHNEAVWRNGGSSPQKVQCKFGSLSPARSSVAA